jgi:hypothetical protein
MDWALNFLSVGVLKDQARQENVDSHVMAAEISNNRSCDVAKGFLSALGAPKKYENRRFLVFEKRRGSHIHCVWDFRISPSPYHVRWTILRKQRQKNIEGLHTPILEKKQTCSSGTSNFDRKLESMIVGKH